MDGTKSSGSGDPPDDATLRDAGTRPEDAPTLAHAEVRALLLCDLVDSTRQIDKAGDRRAAEIMQCHDRLARSLLAEYGGLEIDKTDGFFHLFGLPINAVRYALAYHQALADLSAELDVELSARVGIHLGEIWTWENSPADVAQGAKPNEVEGQAKQMAARLMSLGGGRQTLLTSTAFVLARRSADSESFARDWQWVDHGRYLFKGIPEPVEVFEVGIEGAAPLRAPADSEKAKSCPSPASQAAATRGRRRLWAGLGAAAALALASSALWLWDRGRGTAEPAAAVEAAAPSVAVLPFVDMSPQKDQEYFTDGLAEELLNVLAGIERLRVAGRTSSFQFKGKTEDLRVIGEKLNVASILEGSVRKAGEEVRVTTQLVNAADGFQLWSQRYDRRLDDIFAVQDDIARSVAEALELELLGGELAAPEVTSAEAYNAYLQGRYFAGQYNKEDGLRAIEYYEEALSLDDAYAPAWAELAAVKMVLSSHFGVPMERDEARQAAERALELDEGLAVAHLALGRIKKEYEWDWAGAEASFQRALELEPNDPSVIIFASEMQATLGRFDAALELARRAIDLDPLNNAAHHIYGRHAWYAGRLDEAATALRKTLELNPDRAVAHTTLGRVRLGQSRPEAALEEMEREPIDVWRLYGLALAHSALGHRQESDAALDAFVEGFGDVAAFQVAHVHAFRGDADRAFEWLERAYEQRDGGFALIQGHPMLANVEDDPRYAALLGRVGLTD